MGSHHSKKKSSSEREKTPSSQVPPGQTSSKPEISSKQEASVQTGELRSQQPQGEGSEHVAVKGAEHPGGEGVPSMAEVAEEGISGFVQTGRYGDVPSMAEAAQERARDTESSKPRFVPSVAEMAEPLVGGGQPVPLAGPSEGTASRSLEEQADVDRETAQRQKYGEELESELAAYREGQPDLTAGREQGQDVPVRTELLQEPGMSEPLAMGAIPITKHMFVPDEQARSAQPSYEWFECSSERPSPSEQELEVGQTAAFEQQPSAGVVQAQAGERREAAKTVAEQPPQRTAKGRQAPVQKQVLISGESGEAAGQIGEKKGPSQATEPQVVHQRSSALLGEQEKTKKLDELMSNVESPVPTVGEPEPGQPGQTETFGAQSEGCQATPERHRIGEEHPKQTTFAQGEPPLGDRHRQGGFQAEGLPGLASAELRRTTAEGGRREEPSAAPPSDRGESVPLSDLSGLSSEFAKMQFPREAFHESPETLLKSQQQEEQPGAPIFGSRKDVIGAGAESGRLVEYEYLDHPADVQFHSWGFTKEKTFEHMADCMFNYLANTEKVDVIPQYDFEFDVIGEDEKDLLYNFLDELLFRFNTRKQIICKRVDIDQMGVDRDGSYRLHAIGHGEPYDEQKHGCGTEIKAITLASLQINELPDRSEAYVIVDI